MARKGSGGKRSGRKPSARKQTKPEQTKPEQAKAGKTAAAKDTWRGWAFIVLLAVAIVVFVALGAMDAGTRYDLIGV